MPSGTQKKVRYQQQNAEEIRTVPNDSVTHLTSNSADDTVNAPSPAAALGTVAINLSSSASNGHSGGSVVTRRSVAARASGRASRGAGGGGVRESFAAALWNPMKETDKYQFNRRRLIQLFAGVLVATCGGSSFAFGVFSNKIKSAAQLSQSDMATITTTGTVMSSFTFPAGILFDYYGPQYVLGVGTVLCTSGFGLLALIFEGRVPASVYTVALSNGLSNLGAGFFDSGSLMTNLFNFPINRGDVLIIQKTFFGLGSTFCALIFDGFFGPTDNFLGYAMFICGMMLIAGSIGALFIRLPPYKRTIRELKRIAKIECSVEKERERQHEERQFDLFHNPRLTDRRRLNAGVTCLFFTLIFFSTFSIIKTYIEIPADVITGLTVLACICLLSFLIMIAPFTLPKFFDYECLPDLHPPEALVDAPEDDDDVKGGSDKRNNGDRKDDDLDSVAKGREYDNSDTQRLINADPQHLYHDEDDHHHHEGNEGRASSFLPVRASVVGNSAPIAVPEGLAPSILPSITTSFLKSLLQPMIWCLWLMAFAKSTIAVLVANQAQIITSANDGVFDKKTNSLSVALLGIGSAIGRILMGFAQTYFQRREAMAREEQLAWIAEHGPYDPSETPQEGQPDMRPIYHRWNSSVVCILPVCPMILTMCVFLFTFAPVSLFPVIFVPLGAAYGGWISIGALAVREIFSQDVAKHYSFTITSGILGSLLLNRVMFGTWFDQETEKHPAPDGYSCVGYSCFRNSMYVFGSILGLSNFVCAYIVWKWWQVRKTF